MHDFRLFQLAARFGMLDELATALAGTRSASDAGSDHGRSVCVSGFWLGSAQAVLRHARAIGFHPHSTEQARAWLATTEYAGLDELARAAIAEQDKERAAELVAVLALVEAPDAAAYLLQVRDHSRAPAIARQWLERHPAYGLAGLASVIGGSGALAEAAREWALLLRRQGRIPLITAVAASLPAELAARLQTHVIDAVITDHPVYPPGEPAWFAAAAGDLVPSTLPSWADAAALAPIVCSGIRLSDVQVATVVTALVDPAQNIRLLAAVLRHADPLSTDGFAWSLYQRWMADGAPSAHRWAMSAMGLLGGDPCVQKLTPLIRAWPGESQHARAVLGLEVLRQIRTDLALMQLNSIAQKLPFKGLKAKAAEFLEAIAQDKGLTRGELEDRIVPDCDLDERGERSFDFGPRQFSFALGPGLKPVLRDAAGKILSTLPKPTATDDAVKADAAIAAWKLLTKQVADTASVQAARLEQAMVVGRRWRAGDFRRLLIDHPLMIHLVRRLVWEAVPAAGGASTCFRVSDEREVLGVEDDPVDLAAMSEVGLVHPLRMTDSDRGAWSQVFSDYEIAQPFPQLGRPVQYALPDELTAGALTRFTGVEVLAPTLVYGLEKQGWSRGAALDAGGFCEHLKTFPTAACTAIVTYNGNVGMGYIQPEEKLTITGCFLVPGVYAPTRYPSHANRVALRDVDPVVISEVLNDLLLLATRTS